MAELAAEFSALPASVQTDYFSESAVTFCTADAHSGAIFAAPALKSYCDQNQPSIIVNDIAHPASWACNLGTSLKGATGLVGAALPTNSGSVRTWAIAGIIVPVVFFGCNNSSSGR
jgi:hypothetical protein